jgi:hypothetical protein
MFRTTEDEAIMSGPRKIYVGEGEIVEIRVVSKDEPKNADRHKILVEIGTDHISIPEVNGFFYRCAGRWLEGTKS